MKKIIVPTVLLSLVILGFCWISSEDISSIAVTEYVHEDGTTKNGHYQTWSPQYNEIEELLAGTEWDSSIKEPKGQYRNFRIDINYDTSGIARDGEWKSLQYRIWFDAEGAKILHPDQENYGLLHKEEAARLKQLISEIKKRQKNTEKYDAVPFSNRP